MIYQIIRNNLNGDWRMILVELLAFLAAIYFAIVLHEIAHGLVALWNGDDTARLSGRLSLDPIKHIDIMGAIMMLVIGIGWAKPVPVNPNNFRNYRRGMVWVSLAGVITNLLLAATSLGLLAATAALFRATVTDYNVWYYVCTLLLDFFMFSAILNVSLAGFNLLPIFPLDGFRLVETLTPPGNGYVRFMRRYGLYIYIALIALGLLADITGLPTDVLGMYIGVIQRGVRALISLILGG